MLVYPSPTRPLRVLRQWSALAAVMLLAAAAAAAVVVAVVDWMAEFLVLAGSEVVAEGQDGKMGQQRIACRIRLSWPGR